MSTRRLTAIMFADIVGYTAMMQRDEQAGMARANLLREAITTLSQTYAGELLEVRGDGALCIFGSAVEAIRCAKAIQEKLRGQIPLRIGIHIGDIVRKDGHIFGDGVNIASRVESMGVAGAVLFTQRVVYDLKSHPDFQFISLGEFHFKNVEEPMEIFALSHAGFTIPDASNMQGKGQKVEETKAKDSKVLVRAMSLGFLGVLVGILIWLGISWMGKQEVEPQNISKSIAVLPFTDMSQAKNQEYLSDGMAEEVLNLLTQIPELKVTSRSSSFSFKGKNIALPEIAEKLGVSYILEGTDRIDSTYAPTWLLKRNIAEFHALYGSSASQGQSSAELRQIALNYARKALHYESSHAITYALIGNIYNHLFWEFDSADFYMEKALELNPGNAEVLFRVGLHSVIRGQSKEGIALLERAKTLDPVSITVYIWLANYYMFEGELEEAEQLLPFEGLPAHNLLLQSILAYKRNDIEQSDAHIQEMINNFSEHGAYQVVEQMGY